MIGQLQRASDVGTDAPLESMSSVFENRDSAIYNFQKNALKLARFPPPPSSSSSSSSSSPSKKKRRVFPCCSHLSLSLPVSMSVCSYIEFRVEKIGIEREREESFFHFGKKRLKK